MLCGSRRSNRSIPENQTFLTQCLLATGAFEAALKQATELVELTDGDASSVMLQIQALVALHQVNAALELMETAIATFGKDARLLHLARSVAFQNGQFDRAADHALELAQLQPKDDRNKAFAIHAFLAAGDPQRARQYLRSLGDVSSSSFLRKEELYLDHYIELKERAPTFIKAWDLALAQRPTGQAKAWSDKSALDATIIQYWSQGSPPQDVQIVCNNWLELFDRERLGRVELYDRASAAHWIANHAPEFGSNSQRLSITPWNLTFLGSLMRQSVLASTWTSIAGP